MAGMESRNSLVSQSNEWNYCGFTCVLFLHEHVRTDNSSYPQYQPARTNLDPPCFSFVHCFFEVNIQALPWLESPKHCAATHPFGSQCTFTIPRPFIRLELDSFRRNSIVNMENSTTLADLKNVQNMQKNGNNGNT